MEITQTYVLLCWYTSFIYQTFIIALLMYMLMVYTYIDFCVLYQLGILTNLCLTSMC